MNRIQKKIVGWALVAVGILMLIGVAINSYSPFERADPILAQYERREGRIPRGTPAYFDLRGLIVNPLLYLGLTLVVGGVVILKGDDKTEA